MQKKKKSEFSISKFEGNYKFEYITFAEHILNLDHLNEEGRREKKNHEAHEGARSK